MNHALSHSVFANELRKHARHCRQVIPKIKLPKLQDKDDYEQWKEEVFNALEGYELDEIVRNLVSNHEYYVWMPNGRDNSDEVRFRRNHRPLHTQKEEELDDKQITCFYDVSYAARPSMEGRAKTLVPQNKCTNIVEIISLLNVHFGATTHMDKEKLLNEFHNARWNPSKE